MTQYYKPPEIQAYLQQLEEKINNLERSIFSSVPLKLPLKSPWEEYGSGNAKAQYCRAADGRVHIGGLIKIKSGNAYTYGSTNSEIAILPPGYRPEGNILWAVPQYESAPSYLSLMILLGIIAATGVIQILQSATPGENKGEPSWISLAGVSYYSE